LTLDQLMAFTVTDHAPSELQLYGHRPFEDDPDPRPLPDETAIRAALADVFDAVVSALTDTRLEPDLAGLLWSAVHLFHRTAMEAFRDHAAELFEVHTGSSWRPRAGSLVSHRALTAALIDGRDFLAAARRAETEPQLPIGLVAVPGSGSAANLADKARRLGIPVWRFGDGGA
jgi:hypothetical protein